jgi:hypothetical protein
MIAIMARRMDEQIRKKNPHAAGPIPDLVTC